MGYAFKEWKEENFALMARQTKIEARAKDITSEERKARRGNWYRTDSDEALTLFESKEAVMVAKLENRKAFDEHNIKWEQLQLEKNKYMRELKRVRDEDMSKYGKKHPRETLKHRYQLLNLSGKGGFSEVVSGCLECSASFIACRVYCLGMKCWECSASPIA